MADGGSRMMIVKKLLKKRGYIAIFNSIPGRYKMSENHFSLCRGLKNPVEGDLTRI
ncbi:MAG: hypothetical protein GWP06_00765 [Actinobacteria bacterium]|nr:hypothetical protein [Actinomycetota bacterium]